MSYWTNRPFQKPTIGQKTQVDTCLPISTFCWLFLATCLVKTQSYNSFRNTGPFLVGDYGILLAKKSLKRICWCLKSIRRIIAGLQLKIPTESGDTADGLFVWPTVCPSIVCFVTICQKFEFGKLTFRHPTIFTFVFFRQNFYLEQIDRK